ncbi:hypothetical protein CA51_33570 [Rosistilla oblonga]|uniref:hypothetical protein n=1 Tax=Rosistilla oblonga TaxID=2527990 RepID=UPI001189D13B|nr:hypothetical protein [Rosistilla oblonga]QDV13467.1 hypothetical protein CA51_33570 [Rosistilla oblonga]
MLRFVMLCLMFGFAHPVIGIEPSREPTAELEPEPAWSVANRTDHFRKKRSFAPPGAIEAWSDRVDRVEAGFLFVDGKHIPCPLEIKTDPETGQLHANGIPLWFDDDIGQPRYRRANAEPSRQPRDSQWVQRRLVQSLEGKRVVLAFGQRPAQFVDEVDFFPSLLNPDPTSQPFTDMRDSILDPELQMMVEQWLVSYSPSAELVEAAKVIADRYDKVASENNAQIAATTTLSRLTYPMTMFGLIVGVYTFGHLMMTTPKSPALYPNANLLEMMSQATVVSVVLICAHAALDLTWTLLTSQAGQMREINPFGAQFLENPRALVAFKAIATLGACGLLIGLRKHRAAQTACWWMCLVCTILTFRWLIFSSMLV